MTAMLCWPIIFTPRLTWFSFCLIFSLRVHINAYSKSRTETLVSILAYKIHSLWLNTMTPLVNLENIKLLIYNHFICIIFEILIPKLQKRKYFTKSRFYKFGGKNVIWTLLQLLSTCLYTNTHLYRNPQNIMLKIRFYWKEG